VAIYITEVTCFAVPVVVTAIALIVICFNTSVEYVEYLLIIAVALLTKTTCCCVLFLAIHKLVVNFFYLS